MEQYDHGGDVYGSDRPVLDFSISLNPNGPPRKVLEAAREAVPSMAEENSSWLAVLLPELGSRNPTLPREAETT